MANYIGWYWDESRPDVATYWNGKDWSQSRPLSGLVGATLYSSATGQVISTQQLPIGYVPRVDTPPATASRTSGATAIQPGRRAIGGRLGCLLVLLALAVVISVITWVTSMSSGENNPKFTEENGLATCKERISKQQHGSGKETVQGSVLSGNLYKATIAYAGFADAYRWTCGLEWSGDRWTTETLEGHRMG